MSDSDDDLMTLLVLSPIGVPPYSARGLTQSLQPIAAAAQLRRTVNGALLDLSAEQFRKYASAISCSDQAPPAFDALFPGAILVVDCVSRLSYKTIGGVPGRPIVPFSTQIEGDFTMYRPRLTMRVMNFNMDEDEWRAGIAWSLNLEEV